MDYNAFVRLKINLNNKIMARVANPLTGTQKDPTRFENLKAHIRQIGVRMLGSYGLISHETINNYCRALPVGAGSEDKIFKSIRAHEEIMAIEERRSLSRSQALLQAEENLMPIA